MDTNQIIKLISESVKKTNATVYITTNSQIVKTSKEYNLYQMGENYILIGDYTAIQKDIQGNIYEARRQEAPANPWVRV